MPVGADQGACAFVLKRFQARFLSNWVIYVILIFEK
jgi:hypothetical protein